MTKEIKILVFYFALALVVDIFALYFSIKNINNLWIGHFYILIEYAILLIVFSLWQKEKYARNMLLTSIPLFIVLSLTNSLLFEGLSKFPSIARTIEAFVLIGLSAYSIFEISKDESISIIDEPRFWIVGAIFLHTIFTLILFAMANQLQASSPQAVILWKMFNLTINIIANFMYARGILCQVQAQKSGQ